jgi:hypothetical protein
VYRLKDLKGEEIEGIFYSEELVKVNKDDKGQDTPKTRNYGKRR